MKSNVLTANFCTACYFTASNHRTMSAENRLSSNRPDYLLVVVKRPEGWRPKNYFEVPPYGEVISKHVVASYSEAHDDLVRCNRIALSRALDTWAVIKSAEDGASGEMGDSGENNSGKSQ